MLTYDDKVPHVKLDVLFRLLHVHEPFTLSCVEAVEPFTLSCVEAVEPYIVTTLPSDSVTAESRELEVQKEEIPIKGSDDPAKAAALGLLACLTKSSTT